jgi:hypothetical protein
MRRSCQVRKVALMRFSKDVNMGIMQETCHLSCLFASLINFYIVRRVFRRSAVLDGRTVL